MTPDGPPTMVPRKCVLNAICKHPALWKNLPISHLGDVSECQSVEGHNIGVFIVERLDDTTAKNDKRRATACGFACRISTSFSNWCEEGVLDVAYPPGAWYSYIGQQWLFAAKDLGRMSYVKAPGCSPALETIAGRDFPDASQSHVGASIETTEIVWQALNILRAKRNRPLFEVELVTMSEMTLKAAAEAAGVSTPTARKRLQEDLKELARIICDLGGP